MKQSIKRKNSILRLLDISKNIYWSYYLRSEPEAYSLMRFIKSTSQEILPSERVLDAGAGKKPYWKLLNHARYESTDFKTLDYQNHDYICDLETIPIKKNEYDVIICTNVLEHVPYPQRALNEFYRILKPGGKLILAVPQAWGIHQEPYNFFNFTKYGIDLLLRNSGFHVIYNRPRGGIFWLLGRFIGVLPSYLWKQYRRMKCAKIIFPFYKISHFLCLYIISFILCRLDWIDRTKRHTLGYECYCKKPSTAI